MASRVPDEDVRLPVLVSDWRRVTFVHWPIDPAVVQARLPTHLLVDTFAGSAWLTLTPMVMARVGPPAPAQWRPLNFAETNLRTYVRAPNGRDGIYFLRILAASAAMTACARLATGIPYRHGDLSVVEHRGTISYGGALKSGRGSYRVDVRPTKPVLEPSPLDVWLTGRWRAYSRHLGALLETPIQHDPWPLQGATGDLLFEQLSESLGVPGPDGATIVHYCEGVANTRVGASRLLSKPRLAPGRALLSD